MEIEVSGKVNVSQDRHQAEVSKQTGFPSAATHYMEASIDLNEELSIHTRFDDLALIVQDGGFKILRIPFDKEQEAFVLWGVITYIIHCVR